MTATGQRTAHDHSRAAQPVATGFIDRPGGIHIGYEVFGSGDPALLFLPSAPIIHSRQWKGQVPYFGRRHKVVTFDGRGNGQSDRPTDPGAYAVDRVLDDIGAVLDATATERAVLVGLCGDGVWPSIRYAARAPERVLGIVAFAVGVPLLSAPHPWRVQYSFEDELPTDEGWAKLNRHYWRRDYAGFARFFFGELLTEPHSTKQLEDVVGWALDGSVEAMLADAGAPIGLDRDAVESICRSVSRPMLLVHGSDDRCQPPSRARALAALTGASLVEVEGAGHLIPGRHPVLANLLIRDFVRGLEGGTP
jgi:pimeloyl-ACP methyl ester carboxylesterase